MLENHFCSLKISLFILNHDRGVLDSLFSMILIVIAKEFHDRFILLEELQTFEAETIEIVMHFNYGFWGPLNYAALFNFMQEDASSFFL